MQKTLQSLGPSGTLTQGPINGKPVEVVGLQLTRHKFPGAVKKKPQKSVACQSGTRFSATGAQNLTPVNSGS